MRGSAIDKLKELLILELLDDKAFGRTLLGYLPVDLSLLPRGIEVVTWERLSHSPRGEISIGLTAKGFGLESLPQGYDRHYEEWRMTIPPVSKDSQLPNKKNGGSSTSEAPGPYAGKSVPQGYVVDNGNVKRVPSVVSKAIGMAKGLLRSSSSSSGKAARTSSTSASTLRSSSPSGKAAR